MDSFEQSAPWLDHLIHESVVERPVEVARHRCFIMPRLLVAACALLSAPIWLFFHDAPTTSAAVIFALSQIPLISVGALARTGNLRLAQNISIFGWLAMALAVNALTEGYEAVSVTLLAIALVESALTSQVVTTSVIAAVAAALAAQAGFANAFDMEHSITFAIVAAPLMLYVAFVAACAIRAERARTFADSTSARDLRLLTDAIGDIVLHFDRSGAVANIVGDTHKAYNLDRRDLIGRGFFQRVHIADRPAFLKLVSDVFDRSAPMTAVLRVQVGLAPSSSGKYVEPVFNYFDARMCLAQPVEGEFPRIGQAKASLPVVCILRDITVEKRAEGAIAAARAESERAAAGKTRFLANVSHELRTPLNAIIGFSEMLANAELAPNDPAKQREYAQIIANSGNHLLEVVNTILDMSKIESGSMQIFPEPFDLPSLIDQCCDMVQLKADHGGVTLERDYRGNIDELVADKRACKQILINLLSNAVKFTPAGGTVSVRVVPEGNLLAVTVADTGIGIAPPDLARLGDPFFQASASHDRAYEGTGLGLSVVRGLVGLHGGGITVESALKKGTSVTIRLPLDCREPATSPNVSAKIEAIPRHGADLCHEKGTVKKIA
ncbi:HAMP domain-containing histidine kinase [Methylocystis sp. MJC1]|jgi:cell cycle sensor histidine kinase DivJ|uniref:PAS domain-containing sensor histidine kinase n=1 Tax=Methylocystis sp. MJC1 TaxID=2654282 RepID=UPI001FEE4F68|nr:HAMP domain-containing sensor histidine kinase [Methylocystis sp. MJC1]UZX13688.1 HAMP domain-containing histidine kinase [Methylocystis sp. MJC1]